MLSLYYESFCSKAKKRKDIILLPIVSRLFWLHANHVTLGRMAIGLIGIAYLSINPTFFLVTAIIFRIGDLLDGALARYQKSYGPQWFDKTIDLIFYFLLLLQLFLITHNTLFIVALISLFMITVIRYVFSEHSFVDFKDLVVLSAFFQTYTLGAWICIVEGGITLIMSVLLSSHSKKKLS